MTSFESILESHCPLSRRRSASLKKLDEVRDAFQQEQHILDLPITVFCAGSIARLEMGEHSDLDLFVLAAEDHVELKSRLCEFTLFGRLIQLNEHLSFPPFSNDGEYLKIHFLDELKRRTGSRRDDSENLFTVRMLLMLESSPLIHAELYQGFLEQILEHYYRDEKGKKSFRPLFLLNDLLRYWRTLCLNYEERRHEPAMPWRKKNVNLKFSRMLTVFATVLLLVVIPISSAQQFLEYSVLPPLQRLALALEKLADQDLLDEWSVILDIYEDFLSWKEDNNIEQRLERGTQKSIVNSHAEQFGSFLYRSLTHSSIRSDYKRYLVL